MFSHRGGMPHKTVDIWRFFLWSKHFPPPGIRTPKLKFLKNKKISLEKLPWIFTKKSQKPKAIPLNKKSPPPAYVPQTCQKNKGNSFEQKIPPAYVPWTCKKKQRFCLTFTANLSKKIHAKNLKIFFKKIFS